MASEGRLVWLIFAALVALIVVPLGLWYLGEAQRPVLEEVRIVTATADDPVFRTGPRQVPSAEGLRIAAALSIGAGGGERFWLAPVDELAIDGVPVEHTQAADWPEQDRVLRVFWFTVEAAYLGGDLEPGRADKLLSQRSFLAPEMGRGLLAERLPEQHNDDQINLGDELREVAGGTVRLYAKVEVVEKPDDVAALQSAATAGADEAFDKHFPTLVIAAALPEPIHPTAGELFRLPGFEVPTADGAAWGDFVVDELGMNVRELVARRFMVSSWSFAATALTGGLDLEPRELASLGTIETGAAEPLRGGRRLRWGQDVRPGDLLEDRGQWVVLLADDGDGLLGRADSVVLTWRRPAAITILDQAIRTDAVSAELRRDER